MEIADLKKIQHLRREIVSIENTLKAVLKAGETAETAKLVGRLAAEKAKFTEQINAAEQLIENLEKPEHRQVLREHYIANKRIRVIAKESFYSESSIKKFLKKGRAALKMTEN